MGMVSDVLTSPKLAGSVSLGTTATGAATWLSWIPDDIGKLATVVGIALSLVLITYWINKIRTEYKMDKLKYEELLISIQKARKELGPD